MKLRKADYKDKEEQLTVYMRADLAELQKIKPRWAYCNHINELLDYSIHPENNEYTIFLVNVCELIENAEFNEVTISSIFTGNVVNDIRISSILYRWENELFVDPPTVYFRERVEKKIAFADGRHRAKISYLLKIKSIPVAIDNSSICEIGKIIKLENLCYNL